MNAGNGNKTDWKEYSMSDDKTKTRDAKRLLEDLLHPYLQGAKVPSGKVEYITLAAGMLAIREGLDSLANDIVRERG